MLYLDTVEDLAGLEDAIDVLHGIPLQTILVSLVILAAGVVLIRVLVHMLDRVFRKTKLDSSLHRFLKTLVRFLLYLALLLTVAAYLGVNVTSMIALLSALSLAISLSVQNVLSNVAGGLMVMGSKPFRQGDYVSVDGEEGIVDEITTVYTKFRTMDNRCILMPNSAVSTATIVNFSVLGKRRIEQVFRAAYTSDPEKAMAALRRAAERCQPMEGEEILVEFDSFGESDIAYQVWFWAPASRFIQTRFALRRYVWEEFRAAGVEMTYPNVNVYMKQ